MREAETRWHPLARQNADWHSFIMSESNTAPRSVYRNIRRILLVVSAGAVLIAILNEKFNLGLPTEWMNGVSLGERCTVGFLSIHCYTPGRLPFILFLCVFVCFGGCFIFAFVIDYILLQRHREEYQDIPGQPLRLYQAYAWMKRGRQLGDDQLTRMLNGYRRLQIAICSLIVLAILATIFNL